MSARFRSPIPRRVARRPNRDLTPAHPTADHAVRGCRSGNTAGVRVRECAGRARPGGSVIRHAAAPCAVRALAVAVVETPFEAALMPRPGCADRAPPAGGPAGRRAVSMAPVTRCADGEGLAALAAGSLAEGMVHGVGARGARSDWTTSRSRGTKEPTVSVCRSSGRSRGSGGPDRTLIHRLGPLRQLHGLLGRGRGPFDALILARIPREGLGAFRGGVWRPRPA